MQISNATPMIRFLLDAGDGRRVSANGDDVFESVVRMSEDHQNPPVREQAAHERE